MNIKIMLDRLKKFNQIAYVEYLLDNGYLINDSKNYFSNIRLLAIYLRQVKNMKPYTKTILKIANRYGRMFSFYDKFLGGVYSFVTDMSHNALTN